jgi:hypothetical protein
VQGEVSSHEHHATVKELVHLLIWSDFATLDTLFKGCPWCLVLGSLHVISLGSVTLSSRPVQHFA